MDKMANNVWEIEYKEAGEGFRLYTTFFINIVKGFAAGNVVLFAALAYLARDELKANLTTQLVAFLGIVASAGAIIIQRRTYKYWRLFMYRAAEIERDKGLQIYSIVKAHANTGRIRSSIIVLIIYIVLAVFWSMVLLKAFGLSKISLFL